MAQARDADTAGLQFATLIRAGRRARKLSQDALADEVGVHRQTIIRYESGKTRNPLPEELRAVCKVLGIDPREALLALGYLNREELNLPATPTSTDRQITEVIDILGDRKVPAAEKESWVNYLRYLRAQSYLQGDEQAG